MNMSFSANRVSTLVAVALLGGALGSYAAPAAAHSFDPLQVTVKFGDLDIGNPSGAATLYRRIPHCR
jgi:UrcA family protein